jgi:OmpA-OmpF porin, OOP family
VKLRNLLLFAASVLVLPVAAMAQPVTGLYTNPEIGLNYLFNMSASNSAIHATINSDPGLAVKGSLGWGFGNGFRAEVEGNFRYQSCHLSNLPAGVSAGSGSDCYEYGPMVNALYDFDVGSRIFYPYVGIGVGAQWLKFSKDGYDVKSNAQAAAQGIVGVAFPITPQLSITTDVRAMGFLGDVTFDHDGLSGKLNNPVNISGMVGIRWAFNAPPPPPAPAPRMAAPAPAPARTYLVFFDWDKSDLTDRARQIIADAAHASTSVATTQIQVTGNADTSGTPAYNQALSMRRAQSVGAELVKDGVAQNIIMIQAFGDTRPLVPTGPGVREPQNRRVEIVLK